MTDDTPEDDERLAALLAAYEAAQGDGSPLPTDEDLPRDLHGRLRRGVAGLNLATMLRPRRASLQAEPAAGMLWTSLGRCQLRRELGRGGCGIVYLAYDPLLNCDVALKVPRAEVAVTPELRERFQREAEAAEQLRGEQARPSPPWPTRTHSAKSRCKPRPSWHWNAA